MAGACRAYFGEKDFQQLAVVRRMVADLSMPVDVVACPTVREPDGLALSSRNARLSPTQRRAATILHRALQAGAAAIAAGETRGPVIGDDMATVVAGEPLARLDYAAVVDAETLVVPESLAGGDVVRLLIAAVVGPVRLIDNCAAPVPAVEQRRAGDGAAAGRRTGARVMAMAGGDRPRRVPGASQASGPAHG
jgi:pantoate--beta-alanine ligase